MRRVRALIEMHRVRALIEMHRVRAFSGSSTALKSLSETSAVASWILELQQPRRRLLLVLQPSLSSGEEPAARAAFAAAMLTRLLPTAAVDAAHATVDACAMSRCTTRARARGGRRRCSRGRLGLSVLGRYGLQAASMAASMCFALGRALLD